MAEQTHASLEEGDSNGTAFSKEGPMEGQEDEPKSIVLRVIKNFSTVWFTMGMDTGVLSVILHQFPYPSHWTRVCSTIMFVSTLVLFVTFAIIYLLRWTIFFKSTLRDVRKDPEEIALQACPAITWLTLTEQVQLTAAQSWGYNWTVLAFVMWWIALVWVLTILLVLFIHLIKYHSCRMADTLLPTAVFVPIVGVLTIANAAGTIVNGAINNTHLSSTLGVPLIVVGFMLVGFAIGVAIVTYSVYTHRLMIGGWPEALKIPAMILTIGPCGQSASALIQLGTASVFHKQFAAYDQGFLITAEAATIIRIVCVLAALLLVGFAIFWVVVDYYAIVEGLLSRKIHPSLFWWSSIFPVGTLVSALSGLAAALDSDAFRVLAVILVVFLFLIYLVNFVFTIPMTLSGQLLGVPGFVNLRLRHDHKHEHTWASFPRRSFTT